MNRDAFERMNKIIRDGQNLGPPVAQESSVSDERVPDRRGEVEDPKTSLARKERPQSPKTVRGPAEKLLERAISAQRALHPLADQAMLRALNSAWHEYETTGNLGSFGNTVERLEQVALWVSRARFLEPLMEANGDSGLARLRSCLEPGALEDLEARQNFEQLVELLWQQFERDTERWKTLVPEKLA